MAGYQDTSSHLDGDIIFAQDDKAQFALISAGFDKTTGHTHGGGDGEGSLVAKVGSGAKVLEVTSTGFTGTQLNTDLTVDTSPTDVKVPSDAAVEAEVDRLEVAAGIEATRVDAAIAVNTTSIETNATNISTNVVIPQTVSGELTSGGRINQITDSGAFDMPLANSVANNVILVVELPDTFSAQTPTITRLGSDLFRDKDGTDTMIGFVGAAKLTLTSDGVSEWRL